MGSADREWIVKKEPQIFTRVNRQDVPVSPGIIDALEDSEVVETQLRKLIRGSLISESRDESLVVFIDLLSNGVNIVAEVASSPKVRQRGLMYRLNLKNDTGLL